MKFARTLFGLAFCAATVGATPVSTLSAGLYTFSNISCTGVGCGDITASVATQSTSEYGGVSSITFSDNGLVVAPPSGTSLIAQLTYDVSYSGSDPRLYATTRYLQTFSDTPYFSGFEPFDFEVQDTEGSVLVGGMEFTDQPYSQLFYNVVGTSSFSVVDMLAVGSSAANETTPGEFTTTYAAADSPEPSSSGLYAISFGVFFIGASAGNGIKVS